MGLGVTLTYAVNIKAFYSKLNALHITWSAHFGHSDGHEATALGPVGHHMAGGGAVLVWDMERGVTVQ